MSRLSRHEAIVCCAILVLAPVLMHLPELLGWIDCSSHTYFSGMLAAPAARLLNGECFIDGNAGGTLQALGHRSAEDWLSLQLPWWNPFGGAGLPLAGEMQPASFFLPFILLLHFAQGLLFLKISMQMLAGLTMFACLRELGSGRGGALAGALIYGFSGTFAWFGDAPMLPIAFLPVAVLGIERCRAASLAGRPGGVAPIALGLGFSLLAGFPETAFISDALAGLWSAIVLLGLPRAARVRFARKLLAGAAIGLMLASPAVVPFLDDLRHADMVPRNMVQFDKLFLGQGAVLLLPTLFGPPYADFGLSAWGTTGGYLGLGVVFLGLSAVFSLRTHRRMAWLALGWTVFWLAVFFGEPVCRAIWHATPLFNNVSVTRYGMPSLSFLWAVLAGLGWDGWRAGLLRVRAGFVAVALCVVAALTAAVVNHRVFPPATWMPAIYPGLTAVWAVLLLAGLALLLGGQATPTRRWLAACLLTIDVGVPFALPIATGMLHPKADLAPIAFLAAQPGWLRSFGLDNKLLPNYGAYFGVPTLQSFSQPAPLDWVLYARRMGANVVSELMFTDPKEMAAQMVEHRAAFEQAGVGFVLADARHDTIGPRHDPHFVAVFEDEATRIYRLPGVAPYFQVASGHCTLVPHSRTAMDATCDGPASVLRREFFYPGWHATVNGHKQSLQMVADVFQSVSLPAGRSVVRWYYVPNYANAIAILFGSGLAGLAMCLFYKRAPRPNASP